MTRNVIQENKIRPLKSIQDCLFGTAVGDALGLPAGIATLLTFEYFGTGYILLSHILFGDAVLSFYSSPKYD